MVGQGNANFHHAMLSPPVAGQSTFHPASPPHHLGKVAPQAESYYNVPVHQHTHGVNMAATSEMVPPSQLATGGVIPHAHFRHPADLSYSNAEMRQSN